MALSDITFSANTYAGEKLGEILSPALLPKDGMAERGLVTVVPNCKDKKVLRKADIPVSLDDPSATFSGASGDVDLDEAVLDLVKYEFHKELDLTSLYTTWESAQLQAGSLNDGNPPADFLEFIERRIAAKLGNANESLYAKGKAGTSEANFTASYSGILALAEASSDTIKKPTQHVDGSAISIADPGVVTVSSTSDLNDGDYVTIIGANAATLVGGSAISGQSFQITVLSGTTFSIGSETTGTATSSAFEVHFVNESNVISTLGTVKRYIPNAIRNEAKILVPYNVAHAFELAIAAGSTGLAPYMGAKELDYLGDMINVMPHWNVNELAVWDPANVFLGVDVMGEDQEMRILDMRERTNEDTIRIKCSMKSDIKAAYYGEIVYVRPSA